MLKNKKLPQALLTVAAALLAGPALGQGLGNSPYSRLGLGDYTSNTGGVRQLGMGGTGLAAPNSGNINELNKVGWIWVTVPLMTSLSESNRFLRS